MSQSDKWQLSHSLLDGGNNQVHYQKDQQRVDLMIIISNVFTKKEHEHPQCILLAYKQLATFLKNKVHYSECYDETEQQISSRDYKSVKRKGNTIYTMSVCQTITNACIY